VGLARHRRESCQSSGSLHFSSSLASPHKLKENRTLALTLICWFFSHFSFLQFFFSDDDVSKGDWRL
jgi:hypothetical protein